MLGRHVVCTLAKDPGRATGAEKKVLVVVVWLAMGTMAEEQVEGMTEGAQVDSEHYKGERQPPPTHYLIHHRRLEVHDTVLVKIPVPKVNLVSEPWYQTRETLVCQIP